LILEVNVKEVIKMTKIKINIKTPCQESDDRELEAQSDWCVKNIKLEIERCWSNHPRPEDQRLVYAGKLLQDEWVLTDILRQDVELNCHTIHLICRQTSFSPINKRNAATSELRQRKNTNNPQSASATELYQNIVSSNTPGASNSNTSASSINPGSSSTLTAPNVGYDQSNPWQMYLDSQSALANQNAQYLSQTPEQGLMMQQMYAHYMAQYMQYVQSGSMWPAYHLNGTTTHGNIPPAHAEQLQQRVQNPAGNAGLNPVAAGAAVAAVVGGHTTGPPAGGHNAANQVNHPNVADQNAGLPQVNPGVAQAAPPVPAMNGPGANPANVVMNAGAGGMGAMEEEDEDGIGLGGQRDILDWFYVASRVLVLFSIVYFYSSLARFALVAGLGLAVYLYRIGFFGQRIGGQGGNINANNNLNQNNNIQQNRPNDNQPQQHQPGRVNGDDDIRNQEGNQDLIQNDNIENEVANGTVNDNSNDLPPVSHVQLEHSWYQVATTFLTTFFTSLMPNEPQVI